ncbi:Pimeloyl-ACP methyl ester carboxylesterase [Natronobacterium gregoryi]|uniref:Alpha/beta fold family hydrolase n=2 Tax=Natronobacterium gregoryi TaxID=44930 RepID=L9XR71_NATGS|nr:alpha/beta fold family hydrolase [Natronobacterium gregoryi SP2]PLK20349.1 alpha/beta hydrolase [Natronobacterium gregoryi SP2]SFJ23241.1 Pimeloyl-ACP methyl ester carboxylesterase [Natronobacterium gregoryi]
MPGCGRSFRLDEPLQFAVATECLLEILDEEGIDSAVLVGQSMGSLVSQYVCDNHPDHVTGMVHVGGFPLHGGLSDRAIRLLRFHLRVLKLMPERTIPPLFARAVAHTPSARAYVTRVASATGKEQMLSLERGLIDELATGIPSVTDHPQRIVVGEHEASFLQEKAMAWNEALPDSIAVTVPEAGHIANHDNPDAITSVLHSFLSDLNRDDRENGDGFRRQFS